MTNCRVQDIIILMDESGSMNSMGDEPLQTVNEFIIDQKRINQYDGSTLSFWKFNSEVTKVIDDIPLTMVNQITDYQPGGLTALNDAIGMAVTAKFNSHKKDDVICMIITDGMENASKEYTTGHVKSIIEDLESKHRWKFIYLGTKQNTFTACNDMGVDALRCLSYNPTTRGGLRNLARNVSDNVANYRSVTATTTDPVTLNFNNLTLTQHQSEPINSLNPLPIPVLRRSSNVDVTPAFLPHTPDLEPNTPDKMVDLPEFELR